MPLPSDRRLAQVEQTALTTAVARAIARARYGAKADFATALWDNLPKEQGTGKAYMDLDLLREDELETLAGEGQ